MKDSRTRDALREDSVPVKPPAKRASAAQKPRSSAAPASLPDASLPRRVTELLELSLGAWSTEQAARELAIAPEYQAARRRAIVAGVARRESAAVGAS
jgi:hypothetical protein